MGYIMYIVDIDKEIKKTKIKLAKYIKDFEKDDTDMFARAKITTCNTALKELRIEKQLRTLENKSIGYFLKQHDKARALNSYYQTKEWLYKDSLTIWSHYWQENGAKYYSIAISYGTRPLSNAFIHRITDKDMNKSYLDYKKYKHSNSK